MDTIGLLASWVGIFSFVVAILVAATIQLASPLLRRLWPNETPDRPESPDNAYIADLVSLYGQMLLNLVAAVALMIMSLEIVDLGPALLASTLPFNIDAKLLTRATGLFLLIAVYWLVFRLAYLAIRIRRRTHSQRPVQARLELRNALLARKQEGTGDSQVSA
jgi:hypothetical protein